MSTILTIASIENKDAGDEVSVAISIDTDSGDAISALDLVFKFDPDQLEPLFPVASAGSLTQSWGSPVANATQGQIQISQSSASPLSDNTGEILILNFKIKEGVTDTIALDLDETSSLIMEGEIDFTSTDGVILLSSTGSVNSTPTGTVLITGTASQGHTLSADTSAIADADGFDPAALSYQWKADGSDINGATASSFVLTQAEVGKTISVTASYTDGQGTAESLTSAATAAVSNSNDSPTGTVTITGTAKQGETLTAVTSAIADADGLGSGGFSYQWKADGAAINGATSDSFTLTQDQVGKAITVTASYTDAGGTAESLTSAATAAVSNINDSPTAVADTASTTENAALTVDVIANDTDPDASDGLSLKAGSAAIASATEDATNDPINLTTASVAQSGNAITFNPSNDFDFLATGETASVTINYIVDDGNGGADNGTLSITVTGTNDGPAEPSSPVLTIIPDETNNGGSVVINPESIPQGDETLVISSSGLPEDTQPIFKLSGGVDSTTSLSIDF